MASNLPIGWGNRNNTMSEQDMAPSSKGAYGDGTKAAYKSSNEVKAFYMEQIDLKSTNTNASLSPPVGQVVGKQNGALASSNKPEVALVQVATHTLNALAGTLEGQTVSLPMEERAAFAAAIKRAMDALAKCP
jgi:hypothetical protein